MTYLFYSIINSVIKVGNDLLQKNYDLNYEEAGLILALGYLVSGLSNPLLGLIVDYYGKRIVFMTIANILFLFSLGSFVLLPYLSLTGIFSIIPIILFGLSYSMTMCVLWPILPIIVDKKVRGLAGGID